MLSKCEFTITFSRSNPKNLISFMIATKNESLTSVALYVIAQKNAFRLSKIRDSRHGCVWASVWAVRLDP